MAESENKGAGLYWRLSIMMFLQFAVWGAWSVMIATHMQENLHFDGPHISYVFGTTAFGALLSPLIAGWIADRFMPNQLFTALSHLVGAALLVLAWHQTSFWPLEWTMIAYAFTYMPTISLTNAIAFHHMGDSNKFGMIRVWGSLGWIFVQSLLAFYLAGWGGALKPASLFGGLMHFDQASIFTKAMAVLHIPVTGSLSEASANVHSADCFIIAAVSAVLMGIYCFTLPNTPPTKNAKNPYAFVEAFKLTENRNFAILLLISFVVAIELPFYYNLTLLYLTEPIRLGGVGLELGRAQFVMTYGQWGEVAMMALLVPMIRYAGVRWTILIGILAWPIRYAIFAWGHANPALIQAALPLHGVCYAFFFAGGMVAVERFAHKDIRASAQGLMVFATNGFGMLIGHFVSGRVHEHFKYPALDNAGRAVLDATGAPTFGHHWAGIFMIPIVVTLVAGVLFLCFFNERQFQEDSKRIKAEDSAVAA